MTESFLIQSRLNFEFNVNSALSVLIEQFETLDDTIKESGGVLKEFEDVLRDLKGGSNSGAGDSAFLKEMKTATELARDLADTQGTMRTAADQTAAAWAKIAASMREAARSGASTAAWAGSGDEAGAAGTRRRSGGRASSTIFGNPEDQADARWEDQDWNARSDTGRKLAEYINNQADAAAANLRRLAELENADFETRMRNLRAEAEFENQAFEAAQEAMRKAADYDNRDFDSKHGQERQLADLENKDFDARLDHMHKLADFENSEFDRRMDQLRKEADLENQGYEARKKTADRMWLNDYHLANHENRDRDAIHRHNKPHTLDAALGAQMAGESGTNFFEKAIMSDAEYEHSFARLTNNTTIDNDKDKAAIRAEIAQVTRNTGVLTRSEVLEVFQDIFSTFGDYKDAMKELPTFANMVASLKVADVNKGGEGDIHQALSAARAIEDQGGAVDLKDPSKYNFSRFDEIARRMVQVYFSTNGRVAPDQWYAFQKSARTGSMDLNDHALYEETPYFMNSLGASKFGTALMSDFQVMVGGRLDKVHYNLLSNLGLIKPGSGHWVKGQGSKSFVYDSAGLTGMKTLETDPYKWINDVLVPAIDKKYKIDPTTEQGRNELVRILTSLGQRTTIAGIWADIAREYLVAQKEGRMITAQNHDPMAHMLKNDPMAQILRFQASENEMMVTVGDLLKGPAIGILDDLVHSLHGLVDEMNAHPETAKLLVEFAAGASVVGNAIGGAALSILMVKPAFSWLLSWGKDVGGLFASGTAEMLGLKALATGVKDLGETLAAKGLSAVSMAMAELAAASSSNELLASVKMIGMFISEIASVAKLGNLTKFLGGPASFLWDMLDPNKSIASQAQEDTIIGKSKLNPHRWDHAGASGNPNDLVAPPPGTSAGSGKPVPVHITNPGDLVSGVSGGIAKQSTRPPSGTTTNDLRMDLTSAWSGAPPP